MTLLNVSPVPIIKWYVVGLNEESMFLAGWTINNYDLSLELHEFELTEPKGAERGV
jgi:hypothetical protein